MLSVTGWKNRTFNLLLLKESQYYGVLNLYFIAMFDFLNPYIVCLYCSYFVSSQYVAPISIL